MTVVRWVIERVHCGSSSGQPAADKFSSFQTSTNSSLSTSPKLLYTTVETVRDSREATTILDRVFVFVVEETQGRMATGGQVPLAAEHTGGCGIEEICLKTKHT